jgi:hypothetical protein
LVVTGILETRNFESVVSALVAERQFVAIALSITRVAFGLVAPRLFFSCAEDPLFAAPDPLMSV